MLDGRPISSADARIHPLVETRGILLRLAKINGVPYDMNIEVQGTKVIGSEKLASRIELTIIFSDSSKCSASLWVAD
jgi:hypothetical protein